MTIGSNNLAAMITSQNNIANSTKDMNNAIIEGVNALQNVSAPNGTNLSTDFLNSYVAQIPEVIAYEANAQGIKTKDAVLDTLLDIKA